mgnify:CR=1
MIAALQKVAIPFVPPRQQLQKIRPPTIKIVKIGREKIIYFR